MSLPGTLSRISARTKLIGNSTGTADFRWSRPFSSFIGSPSQKLREHYCSPFALVLRKFLHSGKPKEAEMENNSRPMDYARSTFEDNRMNSFRGPQGFGRDFFGGSQVSGQDYFGGSRIPQYNFEQNADIVHMKLLRNNTFITVTDSKGNRKPGQRMSASAGSLPDRGGKSSRFGAEATAEHVGRKVRDAGVKSVVVKVNGFTFFKKKRQAIVSFREGFTNSRGDQNPIVYIEDTTRRPHNGCRLPKKRRI